jgi:4-aminobutyrate aminotransferase-like enzyme
VHLALTHTKRRYIITFSSAYHGMGLGTKQLNGLDGEMTRYLEAWTGGVIKAPYPYSDQSPAAPRNNIAGILVEPGLAEGGNWIPPTNLLKGIREICDKNDWLMISDEVLTGLGRTGKMWGIEHYDVIPDILVVGKNLSGGIVPCAGIASKDEILGDTDGFLSGSTFAGTPAGCAAGIKTLEIYERDKVVEHAAKLGELAAEAMRQWEQYDIVRQVRGNGLLLGVSFESPDPAEKNWWYARSVRNTRARCAIACLIMVYGRSVIAKIRSGCTRRLIWMKRRCSKASTSCTRRSAT